MGTTLTGTTPQDTYDSLIKVTDNGPLTGSLKKLTDGLGNDSSLSLSTTAASLSGTLAVTSSVQIDNELVLTTNNAAFRLYRTTGTNYFDWSSGQDLAISTVTTAGGSGRAEAMRITSAGNVGIGKTAPDTKLHVAGSDAWITLQRTGGTTNIIDFTDSTATRIGYVGAISSNISILSTGSVVFNANSAEVGRFTSNGLTFNGDTAAANALDDYEEGTWTMGVSFGGASVGVTTTNTTGTYTKIGRQVTVNGVLSLSSKGSSSGTAAITGLPFTIGNSNPNFASASLWLINISFANQFQAYGNKNTTTIVLTEITEAGVVTDLSNADFANNSEVMVNFTYFV